MSYIVSDAFRNKEYSGESEFKGRLVIGNTTVPNEQLSKITIEDYIFDSSSSENNGVFYIGTFIAQKVIIKFKNLDGIELHSGDDASLFISQYVGNEWVEIPMGVYQVDELAENYHETCEINLLDYSTKFRKNIDYSPCFVDGKATIDMILHEVCNQCGVELGSYPETNGAIETGQFDSTISGKRWISYIAELKGCNAKIDRNGVLNLIPLNQPEPVISNDNILNSYVTSENQPVIIDYANNQRNVTLKGDTTQITTTGKNLFYIKDDEVTKTSNNITYTYNGNGTFNLSSTTSASANTYFTKDLNIEDTGLVNGQKYTLSTNVYITSGTTFKIELYNGSTYLREYSINNSNQKRTFTVDLTNITKIRSVIQIGSGNTVNLHNVIVQLEVGGTATTIEPYTNRVASPNPDTPQKINVVTGENTIQLLGKNLFDKDNAVILNGFFNSANGTIASSNTARTTYISCKPNTTYTISIIQGKRFRVGTAINTPALNGNINLYIQNDDGTKITITTGASDKYLLVYYYSSASGGDTLSQETKINSIQIEKGNSATDFEQYKEDNFQLNLGSIELCKIGDYQDKIVKLSGKNLFDKDNANVINAYISGSAKITSNSGDKIIYIPCKPNTTYTIQKMLQTTTSKNRFRVGTSETIPVVDMTLNQYYSGGDGSTVTQYTITTNSVAKYLCFFCYSNDTGTTFDEMLASIMIEENSVVTAYEPYGKGWYIEKNIGKHIINSSNVINAVVDTSSGSNMQSKNGTYAIMNNNMPNDISNNNMYFTMARYNYASNIADNMSAQTNLSDNTFCIRQGTNDRIYVKNSNFTNKTGAEIETLILGQPIYYVLANSTNTKITNNILLNQLNNLENLIKKSPTIKIDALQSASWKLGEKYEISKVTFDNGVISYTKGFDTDNTLYIRQDNPFILNQEAIDNIYDSLLNFDNTKTISGTNFELNLPKDISLGNFTLTGNTTQETTSGKNILEITRSSYTSNGITTTYNSNTGLLHSSGTTTATWPWIVDTTLTTPIPSGTTLTFSTKNALDYGVALRLYYTNNDRETMSINAGSFSNKRTVTHDIIKIAILLNRGANVEVNKDFYLQLEIGSSATSFEKFTYGASPNPDYLQPINVVRNYNDINVNGKNLFDYVTKLNTNYGGLSNTINDDGSITTTGKITSNYIPIVIVDITDILEDNEYYTISKELPCNVLFPQLVLIRKDNLAREYITASSSNAQTFQVDKSTYYRYILQIVTAATSSWGNEIRTITNKYQLEKGQSATTFEKFKGEKYTVTLCPNLYNKTNDTDGYFISNTGVMTATSNGHCYSDLIPVNYNEYYTFSGIQNRLNASNTKRIHGYNIYGNWVKELTNFSVSTTTEAKSFSKSFVINDYDVKYIRVSHYNDDTNNQIERGQEATAYKEYSPIELCKIGDYQDTIFKSSGKNLFDKDTITIGNYVSSNGNLESSPNYNASDYIVVNGLKKVTMSGNTDIQPEYASKVAFYTSDKTFISYGDIAIGGNTYTVPSNAYYMRISLRTSNLDNIQVEEGETATSYQPYGSGWYIKKNIGKVILNGSESWSVWADAGNSGRGFYSYKDDMTNTGLETDYNNTLYCDLFSEAEKRVDIVNGLVEKIKHCGGTGSGRQYIAISLAKSRLADVSTSALAVESFKTWLSNNNITVYYQLLTPTYTKITDETLLEQIKTIQNINLHKGLNNISSSGDLQTPLQLNYNSSNQFEMYSLQTRNYGDISLDAWDLIDYELGDETYTTYNNRKLTFEQSIMSDTNVQISNKQQELTTNYIGGSTETQTRKLKTTVNALDNKIDIEVEDINTSLTSQEGRVSNLEISANNIATSVSSLQTLTNEQYNTLNNSLNDYKILTDDELGEINSKFEDYATKSDLITIQNSVNSITTDTYTKTEVNTLLVDGSVKKLQTTSATLDENGMTYAKTNAPTSSNINERGLTIIDNSNNPVLRAVYDDTIKNSIVDTYRHQVHEYFILGTHSRMEDYEDGTGVFDID